MRKIYQKYFELPEEGKGIMGERVFFARLTVAIACIVLCMSAMGFSAYAFFTASVSSNMNQIQAANFAVKPEIVVAQNSGGSASHEKDTTWKYTLQSGAYNVTLNKEGTASTGYCLIKIGDSSFYTQQLGTVKDESGNEIVTRTIAIAVDEPTTIEITACWGTYSGDPLPISETEEMIIVDESGIAGIGGKLELLTTSQTVNETVNTVADSPAVTSEPTATSTPESTSTPSETPSTTVTEPVTSTETTTPASTTTPTETTNTQENTVTPPEEKKDDVTPSTNSTE